MKARKQAAETGRFPTVTFVMEAFEGKPEAENWTKLTELSDGEVTMTPEENDVEGPQFGITAWGSGIPGTVALDWGAWKEYTESEPSPELATTA